jgi:predicted ArsR family transcriptional regulator
MRDAQAALRAMATRPLRMLSLLTGAPLTAAEVARELGLTHANASYHLRNLLAAGLIVQAGEERIRGGVAKRYRYDAGATERDRDGERARRRRPARPVRGRGQRADPAHREARLVRRRVDGRRRALGRPEVWREIRDRIAEAAASCTTRPAAAHPGTIRTSTTIAMFRMEES